MPATHRVFGEAQTINSANFIIIVALDKIHKLNNPPSVDIFIGMFGNLKCYMRLLIDLTEELQNLHVGQSYDLYWTRNTICPTEEDYLEMIEKSKYHTSQRKFWLRRVY